MATLKPVIPKYPLYSSQLFIRAGPGSDAAKDGPPLEFRSNELIHDGNSRVFRGKFKEMVAGRMARKVVCKIVVDSHQAINRLKSEAELYENNLKTMQGDYVARFYGFFTGTVAGDAAACILLEDCGVVVSKHPVFYDIEFCVMVLQALMYIHKNGVEHGDFSPGNMVVDNDENPTRVVIIDFDRARLHHCERKLDIHLYQFPPSWDKFNCRELYAIALELDIWTPTSINYRGAPVSLQLIDSLESIVANGPGFAECELQDYDPIAIAAKSIQDYVADYGGRGDYIRGAKWKTIIPTVEEDTSSPSEAA